MKTAAAYIRVSTDDQVEYSPDSQLKAIRSYAKAHGMILPEEFVFIDEGISGRTAEKRPAFMQMIGTAKIKPREFDVILLWKFSRFARNREDSILYKSMLRKQCGIEVISISENLGDDKTSVLIEALIEAMDEYYSINLAEEVRRGMTEKLSRGEPVAGAPYGYKMIDKKYVIDENTATVVRRIFDDFTGGKPLTTIARELNSEGIVTKYGNPWENRTVEYVLRNVTYTGKLAWNEQGKRRRSYDLESTIVVQGIHEPLISEEQFQAAQDIIAQNKAKYGRHSHPQHGKMFALKGLLRCSSCGGTLFMSTVSGVQCNRYAKGTCDTSHYIRIDKITPIVLEQIRADMNSSHMTSLVSRIENDKDDSDRNDQLKRRIEAEQKKLHRAKEAYMAEIDTLEEYKANKAAIQKKIDELSASLKKEPEKSLKERQDEFRAKIADVLEIAESTSASEEAKNEALHTLIKDITFFRKSGKIEIIYK